MTLRPPNSALGPRRAPADSLVLAMVNVTIALCAHLLERSEAYRAGFVFISHGLLFGPGLACLALAFSFRDLRHGRRVGVAAAVVLTLMALGLTWSKLD